MIYQLIIFYSWNGIAQVKKQLTVEDYKLWHKIMMGVTSYDGTWLSYTKSYKGNIDTLYLTNTRTNQIHIFPKGNTEQITPNGKFFTHMISDTLKLLEINSGKILNHLNVEKYQISKSGKHLIYLQKDTAVQVLNVKDLESGNECSFENVIEFNVNPQGDYIYIIQDFMGVRMGRLINLNNLKEEKSVLIPEGFEVQQLAWNFTGRSLAYILIDKELKAKKVVSIPNINKVFDVFELDQTDVKGLSPNRHIAYKKLYVSDDGDKVFFDTVAQEVFDTDNHVQIWRSADSQLPPKKNVNHYQWNVWKPKTNDLKIIENDTIHVCALSSNQEKALLLDNNRYLPLYDYGDRYSDVYVLDLKNGDKTKVLEKQLRAHNHLVTSIYDDYIVYFKNNNWWSYNIKTKQHTCLTKGLGTEFNKSQSDRLDTNRAHGFGGWTTKKEILVYDTFDIWLLSLDGAYTKKMTNGVGDQIKHRLYKTAKKSIRDNFFGHVSENYDLKNDLLIKTLHTKTYDEGFGIWSIKQGFKELTHKDRKISFIKRTEDSESFLFSESSFHIPPRLMKLDSTNKESLIALSNVQQDKFYWGKSKLIHYVGPQGEMLKAALFYPGNYDARKKYPMIVSIYEKRSDALHNYTMPSETNYGGLNIANYTAEGYFVLMPDIAYKLNSPGKSALTCVLSSIEKAQASASIDQNKIGLIGHSFGGFETTYIISQTDRFKTAIAGAGVTDLLSFYLDIDSANLSNMERFESEQFRIQIPFTELAFSNESPIMNVKTIHTPVMLFIGDKDQMVRPSYNIKLFAALWRLKKESVLLIYPNEGHTILNEDYLKDLTLKTKDWFDYHLKDGLKTKWMVN